MESLTGGIDRPPGDARSWVVLKYGGTSVASADRWAAIAARAHALSRRHRVWIVASAIAGVSNLLESAVESAIAAASREVDREPPGAVPELTEILAHHRRLADALGIDDDTFAPVARHLEDLSAWLTGIQLTGEAPPRLVARIMALGELCSTRLGAAALAAHGVTAAWADARTLLASDPHPTETDDQRYLEATIPVREDRAAAEIAAGEAKVVLTQGFIARTPEGETCLLGRGGSDTSAALFAALLGAKELEIWTDVHGMFTADPRLVPSARLVRRIGFREAQELAAMGAKVLHPRCLSPVRKSGIPLSIHCTGDPDAEGTRIEATVKDHATVTAVTRRTGVTMLSISTIAMWRVSGFLASVFRPFEELGVSIDLVATSQASISLTLDHLPGGVEGRTFARLMERLEPIGRVKVVHPCAVVSIVGRRIRAALDELGPAMSVFHERAVHLVSDSAEDLNLSFVVDEQDAHPLVVRLHEQLFSPQGDEDERFGPSWEELSRVSGPAAPAPGTGASSSAWWRDAREELLALAVDGEARYVYDLATVAAQARTLREGIPSVARFYYAMKANGHPRVLETVRDAGFGIECVSLEEIRAARETCGDATPLLFTPNFCPMSEYEDARALGAEIVVDGPEPLRARPELFRDARIGVRIDPGRGRGHHAKVRTAGSRTKFGHPIGDVDELAEAVASCGATVVGLHAHVGSGIFESDAWAATGALLTSLRRRFPDVEWVDVGGGLGVPERPGQPPLEVGRVEQALGAIARGLGDVSLRLEPGRYLVSEAGVLVAPVSQVREKGGVRFVGLATGMNSLVRPALYGAWHSIHNLTRLDDPPAGYWHVVGPICESSDVLGRDRLLPETRAGDVVLIENAGAYGAVMASRYNMRAPAVEVVRGV